MAVPEGEIPRGVVEVSNVFTSIPVTGAIVIADVHPRIVEPFLFRQRHLGIRGIGDAPGLGAVGITGGKGTVIRTDFIGGHEWGFQTIKSATHAFLEGVEILGQFAPPCPVGIGQILLVILEIGLGDNTQPLESGVTINATRSLSGRGQRR